MNEIKYKFHFDMPKYFFLKHLSELYPELSVELLRKIFFEFDRTKIYKEYLTIKHFKSKNVIIDDTDLDKSVINNVETLFCVDRDVLIDILNTWKIYRGFLGIERLSF